MATSSILLLKLNDYLSSQIKNFVLITRVWFTLSRLLLIVFGWDLPIVVCDLSVTSYSSAVVFNLPIPVFDLFEVVWDSPVIVFNTSTVDCD